MTHTFAPTRRLSPSANLLKSILLLLVSTGLAVTVSAQNGTSATDGSTPTGMQPGAPAGSYGLSGFDNVNLFNGNLHFGLPLLRIGGRGTAGYTINLNLDRQWRTRKTTSPPWVTWPETGPWNGPQVGYSPGVMVGRVVGVPTSGSCEANEGWRDTLTRLTFVGADGTEYEFRDVLNNGVALSSYYNYDCSIGYTASRGKVFVTKDGSGATFISDTDILDAYSFFIDEIQPSGYLLLKDGTRYRISDGVVTSIQDRNGNKVTMTVGGRQTTDSLNRTVTVTYYYDTYPQSDHDEITFKGAGGATRTLRVWYSAMSTALRSGFSIQTWQQLFPEMNGSTSQSFNPTVASSLELPDGRRYYFKYNPYGELARVELPTGGAFEYDYAAGLRSGVASGSYGGGGGYTTKQIYRRVVEKRIYKDSSAVYESRMTISRPEYSVSQTDGYVLVEQRDYANNLLASDKHYYYGTAIVPNSLSPLSYAFWKDGRELKTESLGTSGNVLRTVENTWEQSSNGNPQISQTVSTFVDTNQVAKQTFLYDQYCNRTDTYEYDFGTGAAGSLVRRTHIDYLTTNSVNGVAYDTVNPNTTSPDPAATVHLRSLPKQVSIYDASNTKRARSVMEYDNYAMDTNHASLWPRSNISGLDSSSTPSFTRRGNTTSTTRYLLNGSGYDIESIATYAQYDIAGNVIKAIDGRGYPTTLDYDDCFGAPDGNLNNTAPVELSSPGKVSYAFATKVTNALGQIAYAQFDYYLGRPVDGQDANGIVASGYYNDVLDRPTQIIRAVGTADENQTTFSYDDANRITTSKSDRNDNTDKGLVSKVLYDGLGRTIETQQYEGGDHYISTKQEYDAMGRTYRTSNAYRPWQNESQVWTTSGFDALGRVTSVTTPDSAIVTTSYNGNSVTVTDQAGKARKSVTDALGRLTSVYEDPSGANYLTSYNYDVSDALTLVTQGVQNRTFVYDSLKRLVSSTNPEDGTVSNTYDSNGNLTQTTDARGVTATIVYDALNRPTSRSYNDNPQTPPVNYFYDSQSLPSGSPSFARGYATGRLVAVTYGTSSSAGTYRAYDAMGRVIRQYQQTDAVDYLVEATYYANSNMKNETYPSVPGASDRRLIAFTNDDAGRLASLNSSATSYAGAASLSSIGYKAHGGLETETLGNSLVHQMSYNTRLQATAVKLGTSGNPTSVLNLTYDYGSTDNNGNVKSHVNTIGTLAMTETFTYDGLNRLLAATETSTAGGGWTETNNYDRYGNRRIDYGGGNYSLTFDASNNRISGKTYDGAGNLTVDGSVGYGYDAEDRLVSINSVTGYKYDGEGRRVRKLIGENTRFIYGIGGELVAEFNGANGNLQKEYVSGGGMMAVIDPSIGTRYTTTDHLGSPRVVTSAAGSVVSRHDYMPFGVELASGVSGRTSGQGYSATDGVRQQFTGQQRDTESGLDYFQARYYTSAQGRFTSVDPLLASGNAQRPQSWNRYAYVYNNPLRLVDPSGMIAEAAGSQLDVSAGGGDGFSAILNPTSASIEEPQSEFVKNYIAESIAKARAAAMEGMLGSIALGLDGGSDGSAQGWRSRPTTKSACNITHDMLMALDGNQLDLFWVVFHEITPSGWYGNNPDQETLQNEARFLASSIINHGSAETISITVWTPGYINAGKGRGTLVMYNEAWDGVKKEPGRGINEHLKSTCGSAACMKLNFTYNAVTTSGAFLPKEYQWWRASTGRAVNPNLGELRVGNTDFLTYNPAAKQRTKKR